jgi:hypothetical protein
MSKKKSELPTESSVQVYETIRNTLADARTKVVVTVNAAMVSAYWEIGKQISEAVGERAEYGLAAEFGKGYTVANLRNMRQFYQAFSIRYALRSELTQ